MSAANFHAKGGLCNNEITSLNTLSISSSDTRLVKLVDHSYQFELECMILTNHNILHSKLSKACISPLSNRPASNFLIKPYSKNRHQMIIPILHARVKDHRFENPRPTSSVRRKRGLPAYNATSWVVPQTILDMGLLSATRAFAKALRYQWELASVLFQAVDLSKRSGLTNRTCRVSI